jgi:hypothetical protein
LRGYWGSSSGLLSRNGSWVGGRGRSGIGRGETWAGRRSNGREWVLLKSSEAPVLVQSFKFLRHVGCGKERLHETSEVSGWRISNDLLFLTTQSGGRDKLRSKQERNDLHDDDSMNDK